MAHAFYKLPYGVPYGLLEHTCDPGSRLRVGLRPTIVRAPAPASVCPEPFRKRLYIDLMIIEYLVAFPSPDQEHACF